MRYLVPVLALSLAVAPAFLPFALGGDPLTPCFRIVEEPSHAVDHADACSVGLLGATAASGWPQRIQEVSDRFVADGLVPAVVPQTDGIFLGGPLFGFGVANAVEPKIAADASGAPRILHARPDGSVVVSRWNVDAHCPPVLGLVSTEGCWIHEVIQLPATPRDSRVLFAVDDAGTEYVAYIDDGNRARFGPIGAGYAAAADHGIVTYGSLALRTQGTNVAFAWASDNRVHVTGRVEGMPLYKNFYAPQPQGMDVAFAPGEIQVAVMNGGTLLLGHVDYKAVVKTIWNDPFDGTFEPPLSTETFGPLYETDVFFVPPEPEAHAYPGSFLEANGLRTDGCDCDMAYVHHFGDALKGKRVIAETAVSTVDNDGMGLVFRLANGSYVAAIATDDVTGTEETPQEESGDEGIVVFWEGDDERPLGHFLSDRADVASPSGPSPQAVPLVFSFDPQAAEFEYTVADQTFKGTLPGANVTGVGIVSLENGKPAYAGYLRVSVVDVPVLETVVGFDYGIPLEPDAISMTSNPQGEPRIAFGYAGTLILLCEKNSGEWTGALVTGGPCQPVPVGVAHGTIKSVTAVSLVVDAEAELTETWVAVGSNVNSVLLDGRALPYDPTPQDTFTSVVLYRHATSENGPVWIPYPLAVGAGRPPAVGIVAAGPNDLQITFGSRAAGTNYWVWPGSASLRGA